MYTQTSFMSTDIRNWNHARRCIKSITHTERGKEREKIFFVKNDLRYYNRETYIQLGRRKKKGNKEED